MAKGYWIGRVDVHDPEAYKKYVAANAVALEKYGAKFLVRGGVFENPEGNSRSRNAFKPSLLHSPKSLGLIGMEERALQIGGAIEIAPQSAGGTIVSVRAPLPKHASPARSTDA